MSDRRLEGTLNGKAQTHTNGHRPVASKIESQTAALHYEWATDPRWSGIERTYSAADVVKLRGSVQEEHTLARLAPSGSGRCSRKTATSARSGR